MTRGLPVNACSRSQFVFWRAHRICLWVLVFLIAFMCILHLMKIKLKKNEMQLRWLPEHNSENWKQLYTRFSGTLGLPLWGVSQGGNHPPSNADITPEFTFWRLKWGPLHDYPWLATATNTASAWPAQSVDHGNIISLEIVGLSTTPSASSHL